MPVSEARLAANRRNGARSEGPKTAEGKAISRRNGLKHGLSGDGIVVPEGDQAEIDRRVEDLTADMKPKSPAGMILIVKLATLSVRAERSAEQESAAIALRVRHAADEFDEERIERANQLFQSLGDDPRGNLRKLRKMPEGVERLIEDWYDLRDDLIIDPEPNWTDSHLERAALLTGTKPQHARGSLLGVLSRGSWGDFSALDDADGGDLAELDRRSWAKAQLFEAIDAEIAALEAHYETLDFETIELDRAEAGARALFDSSKEACLARRYEAESNRGFFKALKELRIVEAESEARAESVPKSPTPARPELSMGSSREMSTTTDREPAQTLPTAQRPDYPALSDRDGQPLGSVRPIQSPG